MLNQTQRLLLSQTAAGDLDLAQTQTLLKILDTSAGIDAIQIHLALDLVGAAKVVIALPLGQKKIEVDVIEEEVGLWTMNVVVVTAAIGLHPPSHQGKKAGGKKNWVLRKKCTKFSKSEKYTGALFRKLSISVFSLKSSSESLLRTCVAAKASSMWAR